MRFLIAIAIIFGLADLAKAQVEPEATSPAKVGLSGTLTYSARYEHIAEFFGGASGEMEDLSGDFGYTSTSERHPTAVTISAGDSWGISGLGFSTGPYENVSVSQNLNGRHLQLQLQDDFNYRNGVGVGEPNPTSTTSAAEPIFSLNSTVLDNNATVRLSDSIRAATTLSVSGSFNQLDYPNGNGSNANLSTTNTNEFATNVGLEHRLEGRNTLSFEDTFSDYMYPSSNANLAIDSDSAMVGWNRTWNRKISTIISAGPEWIIYRTGTPAPPAQPIPPIPSTTGYEVKASASDTLRFGSAGLAFNHGINGGGGYFYGAEVDDLSGSFSRQFGRHVGSELTMQLVGGYRRTDSLGTVSSALQLNGLQGNFDTNYGFAQATRQLGQNFSAFASYSANFQSSNSSTSNSVLNGLWQTVSIGFGFTPQPIHLRQ